MSIRNRLSRFANRYKELLEETRSSESAWQENRPMSDLVKETGKIVGIVGVATLKVLSLENTSKDEEQYNSFQAELRYGPLGFGYYVGNHRLDDDDDGL